MLCYPLQHLVTKMCRCYANGLGTLCYPLQHLFINDVKMLCRRCAGQCAGAMRALWGRSEGAVRALCGCCAGAVRALCGRCAGAVQVLRSTVQMLCRCCPIISTSSHKSCTDTVRMSCRHATDVKIFCRRCANAVRTRRFYLDFADIVQKLCGHFAILYSI